MNPVCTKVPNVPGPVFPACPAPRLHPADLRTNPVSTPCNEVNCLTQKMLSEAEGYDILRKYEIPVPEYQIVKNGEDAANAAEKMGCPVVMKIISPQIVHKSDAGGVMVGIGSKKAALGAFTKIIDNAKAYNADAQIEGVMVEQQAEPGLELIIGGRTDPAFGKVITFGMGGTMVELMKDVTLRILPVSEEEIRQMIHEINAYPLIAGIPWLEAP